ncbi:MULTISPECIES: hypothetical protein [unclassified Corallococcus]|uniref:hypothetical protein n=1 Tax=unclassified Corallococcus TaxID=2685029 RepID=UPI001A8F48A9|nr:MULTISPECIES: hypothetical protein [unclassified Corallococcus]MBN9686495.1 hypothetical protein [Corallococcus sp. NCSPR001]WAS82077.1 hypothetical protein O0N60_22430 [Corallococcus sp. NCRR]
MTNPDWLKRAAERSTGEAGMLGHVFTAYREMEKLSEASLVQRLGCTPEVFQWLSLCTTPDGPAFEEQTRAIADRFGVDVQKLVLVLRRVQVLRTLRKPAQGTVRGTIQLAARDRDEEVPLEDEFDP